MPRGRIKDIPLLALDTYPPSINVQRFISMGFNFGQVFQSVQESWPAAQSGFEAFSASAGRVICQTSADTLTELEKFKPIAAHASTGVITSPQFTHAAKELQKFGDATAKTFQPIVEQTFAHVSTEFNDKFAPAAAGAAAAVVGFAATPVLAAPALALVGFSSVGPVAGSIAAGIQSSIGAVAAGSPFAVAQSIAMGGAVGVGSMIIGGAITAVAVFMAVLLLRRAMRGWKARRARNAVAVGEKKTSK